MLLHFCPARCWGKHAPKVRECTGSPPRVLELSESKFQSWRPKGISSIYRQHLLQMCEPQNWESRDWKTGRERTFMLPLLSLLPLSNLPALCFVFCTCRVEEQGLISRLVVPWSGNYSCNNSSFIGSINESFWNLEINVCPMSNLNIKKSTILCLCQKLIFLAVPCQCWDQLQTAKICSPTPSSPLPHVTCSRTSSLVWEGQHPYVT